MNDKNFAAIFDMDGVIIDNALYHEKAWKIFLKKRGINLSNNEFKEIVFGRTGKDILKILFKDITESEIKEYAKEINATYREEYAPFIKATPGLIDFLKLLKQNNITAAIATSAPPINVEYITEKLSIREYFANTIDDTQVTKGKPDPEIYLASADAINYEPSQCVVFEDSLSGIQAAKNAGMKVVGVATTHDPSELKNVDLVIKDFHELDIEKIRAMFGNSHPF
ncbi:MAG: HAD family phosphatase [Ignavibacteria bacterium]|jgi:HAD superfamily hydrolase (TIGR01509 family)|nr:HAD family phosphatase [Ignavibacteria bacterium]MCU7499550.1 HAD family phosphatase [Ignavibacteria bacterium]MCU7512338.1 HAD family phosphatase [Ignavibacteria bacterium]MCU7519562.1 HAD family phosphatase [Ignavibacteria bacterium]MCU7524526.1 HAD family phosphatase [Ignavibacteria bacterium]